MTKTNYGRRLKGLREAMDFTQEVLAQKFNFNDRQTVSAIESGDRKMSAEELVRATEVFNMPLEFFSNPFLIVGEGRFSWRQNDVAVNELAEFEQKAGEWIGSYRELSKRIGESPPATFPRIGLSSESSFEDAAEAGERVSQALDLGAVPSAQLATRTEECLETLVLMVDMIEGISGAACQIPEINAVLINRREPETGRNFNLAHEVFHLLTWDAMPPEHLDGSGMSNKQKRVEQLADHFAAGLLMPADVLDQFGEPNGDILDWINEQATILGVSSIALKCRLVNTGRISRDTANTLDENALRHNGAQQPNQQEVPAFSRRFLEVLGKAAFRGHISARRVGSLLDMKLDDVVELFDRHDLDRPFEL